MKNEMNITRENYEVFFIDYYDGNLNEVQTGELMLFLSSNPDLEDEFQTFGQLESLAPETVEFHGKESLKRDISDIKKINEQNFDEWCIAYNEGDLTHNQRNELERFVEQNPKKSKNFNLYSKTYLTPDLSVVFSDKQSLKKQVVRKLSLTRIVAYAASVAALVTLGYFGFRNQDTAQNDIPVAVENQSNIPIEKNGTESTIPNSQQLKTAKLVAEVQTQMQAEKSTVVEKTSASAIPAQMKIEHEVVPMQELKPKKVLLYSVSQEEKLIAYTPSKINEYIPEPKETTVSRVDEIRELSASSIREDLAARIRSPYVFWSIAQAGVNIYSKVTETNVSLTMRTDEEGNYVGYQFSSQRVSTVRSFKQP